MATKKSAKPHKATLNRILSTVERGFAAVAEDISDIRKTVATKDDLARVDKNSTASMARSIASIQSSVRSRTTR